MLESEFNWSLVNKRRKLFLLKTPLGRWVLFALVSFMSMVLFFLSISLGVADSKNIASMIGFYVVLFVFAGLIIIIGLSFDSSIDYASGLYSEKYKITLSIEGKNIVLGGDLWNKTLDLYSLRDVEIKSSELVLSGNNWLYIFPTSGVSQVAIDEVISTLKMNGGRTNNDE